MISHSPASDLPVCPICGAGAAPAQSFEIGWERVPTAWLQALARVRAAGAEANARCGAISRELATRVATAALDVAREGWIGEAPSLWADGAGLALAGAVDARIVARAAARGAAEAVRLHQCSGAVVTAARLAVHEALTEPLLDALAELGDLQRLKRADGPLAGPSQVLCASLPGKRLPADLEAARQACVQVMGAQSAVTLAGSQEQFELNAFLPLMTYSVLRSAALIEGAADAVACSLPRDDDVGVGSADRAEAQPDQPHLP